MKNHKVLFFTIFCQLIGTQLAIIKAQFFGLVLNLYIWTFCSLVIMGYIMQSFGLSSDYGAFQFASIVGTVGFFEIFNNVVKNIMDFDNDRIISYYLTLPVRPSVVFASFVTYYALIGIALSIIVFPFGLLILCNSFNVAAISWIKFAIMTILVNIFFGVFTLFVSVKVGTMSTIRNIWSRFMYPLWILGGFQFSWAVLYKLSKPLAYVLLLNPIIFITEGTRATLLGQSSSLSWELCCIALIIYTALFWFYMLHKMKRLLDYV